MKIGETIKSLAAMRTERMNNKEEKEILDAAITYLKRMEPKKIEIEGGGSSCLSVRNATDPSGTRITFANTAARH